MVDYAEASTRSLEEFRRAIGPAVFQAGERGPAPVVVVIRTRNRPALLREALESLRGQTARPAQVVVVNDGGASVAGSRPRSATPSSSHSRSCPSGAAGPRRPTAALRWPSQELVAFLDDDDRCFPDHLERLLRAHRSGPEPVVYSDAVTVVYERREESVGAAAPHASVLARLRSRLPAPRQLHPASHAASAARALHRRRRLRREARVLGGLGLPDPALLRDRLPARARRDLRVPGLRSAGRRSVPRGGGPGRVPAGARRRSTNATRAGAPRRDSRAFFDRLRAQIAFWYDRDGISQGELRYQRESHRRLTRCWRAKQRRRTARNSPR